MQQPSAVHNTFVLERSYPKPPEKVFSAFADATRKRRWFAEGEGHKIEEYAMEFRIGGTERLRYRMKEGSPIAGMSLINEGRFQDIAPNQRIVTASTMDLNEKRISAALVTFEFLRSEKGTDLVCTHQGTYIEWPDGPRMVEAGWRGLLDNLATESAR
ncbi:MAG TPA: SRPBCC family protein [Terriglobales bacterium]|nr:SRPBCC family protein [Terriglobales bacterium]